MTFSQLSDLHFDIAYGIDGEKWVAKKLAVEYETPQDSFAYSLKSMK